MTTPSEGGAVSPARGNLWLLGVAGLFLGTTLVLRQEGFVSLVASTYEQGLPQFHAVFRPDLAVQTRWLYWILMGLGWCALGSYVILLRSRLLLAGWLTGPRREDEGAALALALLVVIGYSCLFVSIRVVRDTLRFHEVAGLSLGQRELLLFGRHTGEPDYRPALAFRERSQGRGTLAMLRKGRRAGFAEMFYAAYLFPIRSYAIHGDTCAQAERAALAASEPRFDWIERGCNGAAAFEPRRRSELP